MDLRRTLAVVILGATIVFAIGAVLERSEADTHSTGVEEGHTDESGEEAELGGGPEPSGDGPTGSDEGAFFAVDLESVPTIILAIVVSVVMAGAVWFELGSAWLLIAVALSMLVFAIFDVREILHQIDESNELIAVAAFVVASLHVGAAVIATALIQSSRRPVEEPSS